MSTKLVMLKLLVEITPGVDLDVVDVLDDFDMKTDMQNIDSDNIRIVSLEDYEEVEQK